MQLTLTYPIGNTGVLRITGLRDKEGELVTTAVISGTWRGPDAEVEPITTLAFGAVAGGAGTFEAAVPADLPVDEETRYTMDLRGEADGQVLLLPGIPIKARRRVR
jgi:hypothetical protein